MSPTPSLHLKRRYERTKGLLHSQKPKFKRAEQGKLPQLAHFRSTKLLPRYTVDPLARLQKKGTLQTNGICLSFVSVRQPVAQTPHRTAPSHTIVDLEPKKIDVFIGAFITNNAPTVHPEQGRQHYQCDSIKVPPNDGNLHHTEWREPTNQPSSRSHVH